MITPKVLLQLDTDEQASVFDAVVALDSGVDQLLRHSSVQLSQVRDLVFGAMFTRGGAKLCRTAIFVGGSDVAAGEAVLAQIGRTFFGPLRVSVMLDSNGANTTAAAAVLVAAKHHPLLDARAVVLAATGPVGSRAVRLLALEGARVTIASRSLSRAETIREAVAAQVPQSRLSSAETASTSQLSDALAQAQIVIAAGAPGVPLLPAATRLASRHLAVAIDLSAVPPAGIEGIEVADQGVVRNGVTCYGAIGVGNVKMKIHKAAVQRLFEANDHVLDAEQIYRIGQQIGDDKAARP